MAGRLPQARVALALLSALAFTSTLGLADTVTLKDGRTFEGTVSRSGDLMIIHQIDGKEIPINSADIQKVTLNSTPSPVAAAEGEWARLQVQIKRSDNLAQIIDLHQKFIAKFPGTPSAEAAAASLANFQQMDGKDFIKFRGQWVSRAKAESLVRDGAQRASSALETYKAGSLKEALAQARDALKVDDENTLANTVAGLAAFQLNDLPTARTYFQKLADVDSSNALAWNNLAVISFQQKREAEALIDYTKALQVAPENRVILDNIAEALHDFSGDQNVKAFKDLKAQADQIETRVAARMADKGFYRYGSTWVTADQRDRLNAKTDDIKNSMTQLDTEYKQAPAALADIDAQLKQAQTDFDSAKSDYNTLAANVANNPGLATAFNNAGYDLLRANQRKIALEHYRSQFISAAKNMPEQAAQLTTALAAADSMRFNGLQRILDIGKMGAAGNPGGGADTSVGFPAKPAGHDADEGVGSTFRANPAVPGISGTRGKIDDSPPPAIVDIPPNAPLPAVLPYLPSPPKPAPPITSLAGLKDIPGLMTPTYLRAGSPQPLVYMTPVQPAPKTHVPLTAPPALAPPPTFVNPGASLTGPINAGSSTNFKPVPAPPPVYSVTHVIGSTLLPIYSQNSVPAYQPQQSLPPLQNSPPPPPTFVPVDSLGVGSSSGSP